MKIVKKTVVLVMSLLLIVNATAQRKVSNEMDYARLLSTLKAIEEKYVDTVNVATIADEAINAMLKKLDPHSTYIPVITSYSIHYTKLYDFILKQSSCD